MKLTDFVRYAKEIASNATLLRQGYCVGCGADLFSNVRWLVFDRPYTTGDMCLCTCGKMYVYQGDLFLNIGNA